MRNNVITFLWRRPKETKATVFWLTNTTQCGGSVETDRLQNRERRCLQAMISEKTVLFSVDPELTTLTRN